jgi:hypothetical protein
MVDETKPEHPSHPHRPPLSRRQLLMQAVVAGVILASGIGIGAGGAVLTLKDRIIWHFPSPPPDRDDRRSRPPDFVEMLRAKYSLSDEQVEKVKNLFAKRLDEARKRRKQVETIELGEREKLVEDMKPILDPDQFVRWSADYQKMIEDMRNRPFWGPRGDHKGPPRGDKGPGGPRGPEGRGGDGPPRPPMGPDDHRKGDRPPDQPVELSSRPGDGNQPR